jgi:hypothetical protein
MSTDRPTDSGDTVTRSPAVASDGDDDTAQSTDHAIELATLAAENRQLREEYTRAQQATYRRTAVGLLLVGLIAIAGGVGFPDARTVLFALGGTGVFASVLTAFITPERFVTASVAGQVFGAIRRDRAAIIDELGLNGDPVYIPGEPCRLFVARAAHTVPAEQVDPSSVFVVTDQDDPDGVTFYPTGEQLYDSFTASATLPETPTVDTVSSALADALVELFALADGVEYDHDPADGRLTMEVSGGRLGDLTALDHPLTSLVAVSVAHTVETPVTVETTDDDPVLITCRYETPADDD